MRVLFRADASVEIGTGHVVRCATLAEALRGHGAEVAFVCRALPGNRMDWLKQQGFPVFALSGEVAPETQAQPELLEALSGWAGQSPIDWLVVDHYGLDTRWESAMRGYCRQILVVDDLANRPHDCDLLLDQNLLDAQSKCYGPLVPSHCQCLLGPKFALLRPEFRQARTDLLATRRREICGAGASIDSGNGAENTAHPSFPNVSDLWPVPRRLLILFGGSDPTQECFKALEALRLLPAKRYPLHVDLVAGASNPRFEELQALCDKFPQVRLHRQVSAMADLMSQADLSIGAGGTTSWERFCLGLPSIVIAVADNQLEISRNLARQGYHIFLGASPQVTATDLNGALQALLDSPEQQQALSSLGMSLVDGAGVQRVAQLMLGNALG